ncbi:uncharacterized protein LOC121375589 [Gigantopelta aegis]|uniref:uncharacterized protein LOC121375589 n=1 Tax=Gigantopelta aegis TaxID=1735272 RepID=UPI001B887A6D|nr:uncharacterized protein LOC121375589 [Gigantopelta aegis]
MSRWTRNLLLLTRQARILSQVRLTHVAPIGYLQCSNPVLLDNFGRREVFVCRRGHATWVTAEDMDYKGQILVYSILGCPHCMKSKNTLQKLNLPYTDINLEMFPQCREPLKERTGKRTVPQIFFNATHVGGNDDLQNLVKDKSRLQQLIEDVKFNAPPPEAPVPPDPSTAVVDAGSGNFVCEPDEYVQLVQELRKSGLIGDHWQGIRVHHNSFVGRDFVNWVVKNKQLERSDAIMMGQALIDKHFGHNIKSDLSFQDNDVYYRLLDDEETHALNAGHMSDCEPQAAIELGEDLRKIILKLYSAFLSPDGKKVDYKGIGASVEFKHYVRLTKELQRVQIASSSREEKLAFFINIYNALVIHANIVRGPPDNLWQRYKFFHTVKYIIGGYAYSLQDIENGVLRSNRKGVGMIRRPFSSSDPRLKVALDRCEPLIHFALVCGARSCPPIKTYSPDKVDEQLRVAAEAFLESPDGCEVVMNNKTIYLTQILKWYQEDFGKDKAEMVSWVRDHVPEGEKRNHMSELIDGKKYKVTFMSYDWSVNS